MPATRPADRRFDRAASLERLASQRFDVVVVGGGVTGAGVALDAASRGLRTALVEKSDLASGTSSKSSKLVHGGIRYLEQREFRLVYESLHERQRLLHNAPHLVELQPFLIPLFGKGGVASKAVSSQYATALWLYDITGGWRIGKRHRRVTKEEAQSHMPTLRTDMLASGFLYYDCRVDDARLTLSLARTAALDFGATVATYARVSSLHKDSSGRITGVVVDGPGMEEGMVIDTLSVVNATGVWADEVRSLDEGDHPGTIRPAKGVHIAVPREKLPCDIASVIPVRKDRRSIFVIPWAWGEETYIGTTDTDYQGPLDDPTCTEDDIAYLIDAVNAVVSSQISRSDVTGSWAGLRPLLATGKGARSARTADLSRRHAITVSDSGMVTVTGGKLTTYRKMAADTVDALLRTLGHRRVPCRTQRMVLHGGRELDARCAKDWAFSFGVPESLVVHLMRRYGSETPALLALCRERPELADPLVPGTPYIAAEAVFAVRAEMAQTLDDVLARRTRALIVQEHATLQAAESVADLIAGELGWDQAERDRQVKELRSGCRQPADRPLGGGETW